MPASGACSLPQPTETIKKTTPTKYTEKCSPPPQHDHTHKTKQNKTNQPKLSVCPHGQQRSAPSELLSLVPWDEDFQAPSRLTKKSKHKGSSNSTKQVNRTTSFALSGDVALGMMHVFPLSRPPAIQFVLPSASSPIRLNIAVSRRLDVSLYRWYFSLYLSLFGAQSRMHAPPPVLRPPFIWVVCVCVRRTPCCQATHTYI